MRRFTAAWQPFAATIAVVLALGAQPAFASNDPLEPQQWGLAKIQSEASWGRSTGAGVIVAVVDTGVNFAHEDLQGASAGSFTCIGGECVQGGDDDNGHGTWVAGIIAARANNGKGIAGVAPEAKILSIKALNAEGLGDLNDVSSSIHFAADRGAKVINLSLGSDLPLPTVFNLLSALSGSEDPFQAAVDYAASKGAAVVAAAGNGTLASGFAGTRNLLLVGATGPNDHITGYSASLLGVMIHAPGGEAAGGTCDAAHCILATDKGGGYRAVQGTSFAAPHVSGAIAQLVALGSSPFGAESRLLSSADLGGGFRRLNIAAAVQGAPVTSGGPAPAGLPGVGDLLLPGLTKLIGLGGGAVSPPIPAPADAGAVAPTGAGLAGTVPAAPRAETAPAGGPAGDTPATAGEQAPQAAAPAAGLPGALLPAASGTSSGTSSGAAGTLGTPSIDVVAGPGPALAAPAGLPAERGPSVRLFGLLALSVVAAAASRARSHRVRTQAKDAPAG